MRTLKKTLSLVLALVLCFGLVGTAFAANFDAYTDAETVGAAYVEAADVMLGLGVIKGMTATEIGATGTLTREQAAKIVAYIALGGTVADMLKADKAPFDDVAADRWSAGYISYCADKGILAGYGDGNFGPADELTGFQFAKMLLVAIGYGAANEFTPESWSINTATLGFASNLFKGDATAAVHTPITRQQAMLMAFNALNVDRVVYSKDLANYQSNPTATNFKADTFKLVSIDDTVTANQGTGAQYTVGASNYVYTTDAELQGHAVKVYIADNDASGTYTAADKVVAVVDNTSIVTITATMTAAQVKAAFNAVGVTANLTANSVPAIANGVIGGNANAAITLGTTAGAACAGTYYVSNLTKAVTYVKAADSYKVSVVAAYQAPTATVDGYVKVTGLDANAAEGTAANIVLNKTSNTAAVNKVTVYEGIKVGDYVAIERFGTAPVKLSKVDTVVGAVAQFTDATVDTILVNGTTYAISAVADLASIANVTASEVGATVRTLILDKAGAVVGYTGYTPASNADSYAKILDCAYTAGEAAAISNGYTAKYAKFTAYVLLANGTKTTLTYTSKTKTAVAELQTEMGAGVLANGNVVKFAANNGVITEISAAKTEAVGTVDAYALTAKTAKVGTDAYLAATTPVVYMNSAAVANPATLITGYAAVEAAVAAKAFFVVENNAIVCVFVDAAYVGTPTTAKTVAYLNANLTTYSVKKWDATIAPAGAYVYGYNAYVDGVATTLWSLADDLTASAGFVEYTVTNGYVSAISNTVTGMTATNGTVEFIDETIAVIGGTQVTIAGVKVITDHYLTGVSATGTLAKNATVFALRNTTTGALVYAAIDINA